jgi:hypothetical protein
MGMNRPEIDKPEQLDCAVAEALRALREQAAADPDLVVSEADEQGRVQIEGTVDLRGMLAGIPGVRW